MIGEMPEGCAGPWMGTEAAATYIGVTARTVYRLIDRGEVTGYRIGRVVRLRRTDLDGFLDRSRIEPGELRHLYPRPRRGTAAGEPRARS